MRNFLQELIGESESRDGYARERAVHGLCNLKDPRAIPALLVRANDWVPQVRAGARAALDALLAPPFADAWVQHLPTLYHLKACHRDNHAPLIAGVESLLILPESREVLMKGLNAPGAFLTAPTCTMGPRTEVFAQGLRNQKAAISRCVFRLVARHEILSEDELLEYALATDDVVIKRYAEDYVRDASEIDTARYQRLLQSWHRPLRRRALQRFAKEFPGEAGPLIEKSLLDRSYVMREAAQRLYRERGGDPAKFYVEVLGRESVGDPVRRNALLGLGSTGDETYLFAIRPHLDSECPAVRAKAFGARVLLDSGHRRELIVSRLERSMGDGCFEALRWARRYNIRLTFAELEQLLDVYSQDGRNNRSDRLAKRIEAQTGISFNSGLSGLLHGWVPARVDFDRLIRLARLGNKWDQLFFLLMPLKGYRLNAGELAEPRVALLWELQRWLRFFNRSQIAITQSQAARLREPIAQARRVVDDGLMDAITWHVFGPEKAENAVHSHQMDSAVAHKALGTTGAWIRRMVARLRRLR